LLPAEVLLFPEISEFVARPALPFGRASRTSTAGAFWGFDAFFAIFLKFGNK
jgi:hypothetical protein